MKYSSWIYWQVNETRIDWCYFNFLWSFNLLCILICLIFDMPSCLNLLNPFQNFIKFGTSFFQLKQPNNTIIQSFLKTIVFFYVLCQFHILLLLACHTVSIIKGIVFIQILLNNRIEHSFPFNFWFIRPGI